MLFDNLLLRLLAYVIESLLCLGCGIGLAREVYDDSNQRGCSCGHCQIRMGDKDCPEFLGACHDHVVPNGYSLQLDDMGSLCHRQGNDGCREHQYSCAILDDEVYETRQNSDRDACSRYTQASCRIELFAQFYGQIEESLLGLVKLCLHTLILCVELVDDRSAVGIGLCRQVLCGLDVIELVSQDGEHASGT